MPPHRALTNCAAAARASPSPRAAHRARPPAVTYFLALVYCFFGIAIISDTFMCVRETKEAPPRAPPTRPRPADAAADAFPPRPQVGNRGHHLEEADDHAGEREDRREGDRARQGVERHGREPHELAGSPSRVFRENSRKRKSSGTHEFHEFASSVRFWPPECASAPSRKEISCMLQ